MTTMLLRPSLAQLAEAHVDLTAPGHVDVSISDDGKVIWVNVNGICVLRCCQCESITIEGDQS